MSFVVTDCPDRFAPGASCGRDGQCTSQRCRSAPKVGNRCTTCTGSKACNERCNQDDECCSNNCGAGGTTNDQKCA